MNANTTENERAMEQAKAQLESIKEMVSALACDYDRLKELRDMEDEELTDEDRDELKELEAEAGECEDRDDAEQRIHEDPLSVEVRSDWCSPGEEMKASEYMILLCTGGPAARIVGDLDKYNEPSSARLEYQDWFTPWMEYITTGEDHDALVKYARCFYFGA